jgi:hypothetical protein
MVTCLCHQTHHFLPRLSKRSVNPVIGAPLRPVKFALATVKRISLGFVMRTPYRGSHRGTPIPLLHSTTIPNFYSNFIGKNWS